MALYHFHVEQIKRSEGRTAVASAAYRAGEKLHNLWDGETHDYTVHEKSSLAPPGQSLAFSLGDEKGFRWIGAYDISAEDLLAGGEGNKTELKQEQAVKLIEEFLSEGRKVSIAEINKEATERGISERTVRLARNSMGDKIASERQGKDWWIWFK